MRILADHPEQDDREPSGDEADRLDCDKDLAIDRVDGIYEDQMTDPFCGWCGDQGVRWIMRDGEAVIAPCAKCSGLDD